jgi:hypothetical protein
MINKKIPVVFKFGGKTAKEVFLIGTFTGWNDKISMIKRYLKVTFIYTKINDTEKIFFNLAMETL